MRIYDGYMPDLNGPPLSAKDMMLYRFAARFSRTLTLHTSKHVAWCTPHPQLGRDCAWGFAMGVRCGSVPFVRARKRCTTLFLLIFEHAICI